MLITRHYFPRIQSHTEFLLETGSLDGGNGTLGYHLRNIREIISRLKDVPINQNGSVWFLPDILSGKEERTCTIPHEKAILVPLLTGMCDDDNTDPNIKTDDGLRSCAMAGNEYGVLSASLRLEIARSKPV